MNTEHEVEPIPGLPQQLPAGERILWQGRPSWKGLAKQTFHVRWVAGYFAILAVSRGLVAWQNEHSAAGSLLAAVQVAPLVALCLGVLTLLAWLNARATVYTLTNRRVVMRFGVALPMTFNLPFKRLAAANLCLRSDGEGDIALQLLGPDRIAWLHLWPHVRPWHFAKAQPSLRSVPDGAQVAAQLAEAMQTWSATEGVAVLVASPAPAAAMTSAAPVQVSLSPGLASQASP